MWPPLEPEVWCVLDLADVFLALCDVAFCGVLAVDFVCLLLAALVVGDLWAVLAVDAVLAVGLLVVEAVLPLEPVLAVLSVALEMVLSVEAVPTEAVLGVDAVLSVEAVVEAASGLPVAVPAVLPSPVVEPPTAVDGAGSRLVAIGLSLSPASLVWTLLDWAQTLAMFDTLARASPLAALLSPSAGRRVDDGEPAVRATIFFCS